MKLQSKVNNHGEKGAGKGGGGGGWREREKAEKLLVQELILLFSTQQT